MKDGDKMDKSIDEKIIRKNYGEDMWHYCRENFSTILEMPGKLSEILLEKFYPYHCLYSDLANENQLVEFKNYIYQQFEGVKIEHIDNIESPKELLSKVGYDFYECKTEEEVQKFRNYYTLTEELCTFRLNRTENCYVFFAVKKDAAKIKREQFDNPKRQDEYGTSVISIQFTKDSSHTLSIKNRYNHMVKNPDATFSNNLENIIPGLTQSFEEYYDLHQQYLSNLDILGYVRAKDGKYYKYNYEINNIYYCPDNIIVDNSSANLDDDIINCCITNNELDNSSLVLDYQDKNRYIVFDYFILDLIEKKIFVYDKYAKDGLLSLEKDIRKIELIKENNNKIIKLHHEDGISIIKINEFNQIISYINDYAINIDDNFLYYSEEVKEVILKNAKFIGNEFLLNSYVMNKLEIPSVISIGNNCCLNNEEIETLELPNLERVGENFFYANVIMSSINVSSTKYIFENFLHNNNALKKINLDNVIKIAAKFMAKNNTLISFWAPNLIEVGRDFLEENETIIDFSANNLENVQENALKSNNNFNIHINEKIY